jgi:hypothetical protein
MKFTGISLMVIGAMMFLLCLVQYMQTAPPVAEQSWTYTLNPIFTFVIAAGSMIAGVLIVRYGGRGYSRTPATPAGDV